MRKIMVFVESSFEAMVAAQFAVFLARTFKCDLVAMYVVDVKTMEDLVKLHVFVKAERMDFEHELEEDGRSYLEQVRELAAEKGVEVQTILAKGEVSREVIQKVKELEVDLLVMAEVEELQTSRDFLFSETERILRKVPCTVVVVKDEARVKELYSAL